VVNKELRFPVRFDEEWWEVDLARSSSAGQHAAEEARKEYEHEGIARSSLRPCETEAHDGTNLDRCFKVYLPPPAGRFGMVFRPEVAGGQIVLRSLAFGARHHPLDSHAETVYQIAHRRLNH
jgi:hypothetical protein